MGIVAEFKKYNAVLKNQNWSVSAINDKNELVVSLWGHKPLLEWNPISKKQIYRDRIDRWNGHGKNEFKINLDIAHRDKLKVRTIIVMLEESSEFHHILAGKDASPYKKRFNAKRNWIGELTVWNGIDFEIQFKLERI